MDRKPIPPMTCDYLVRGLSYLEEAGVDNWDGISFAYELLEQDENE